MRIPRVVLSTALTVLATVWLPATTFGQTYTATVTGTVVDPGGAAVPKVKVVAVNQATKLENTAETSDAGVYRIPFLPFNFLNHPSFNPPAVNFSAPNTFGRITSTISPPRNLEFALKFYF
jgi:Carboxypeptidase regulatory-like domain